MTTVKRPARQYTISSTMARDKNIPRTFIATELKESKGGAVYLYGHATSDPEGNCCRCGRLLTFPGSVLLGIGPECLSIMAGIDGWEARASRFNFNDPDPSDVEALREMVHRIPVDIWLPKYSIKSSMPVEETVEVPSDHKMLGGIPKEEEPKTVTLDANGKFVVIRFGYDAEMVEKVRGLSGRKAGKDKENKWFWTAWASDKNLKSLDEWGFALDDACRELLKRAVMPVRAATVEEIVETSKALDLPGLYQFQVEGVRWLDERDGCGILGHEMGCGKTIMALGYLKLHPEIRPVVLVVPGSLKINWHREATKWVPNCYPVVLNGTKPDKQALYGKDIWIINYDVLYAWVDVLAQMRPKMVIGDEAQKLANNKNRWTKAFKELAKAVGKRRCFLSGTPIKSRPSEFFTILNLVDQLNFNSWMTYVKRYCDAYHDGFGWNVSGSSNMEELHEKIGGRIMLRKTKAEVLKDLPPMRRFVIPMELSNRREYREADEDLIGWILDKFGDVGKANRAAQIEALAKFNYLKQLAAEGKLQNAINWIKDSLDSNGKLVIFCEHLAVMDRLMEELRNYTPVQVNGGVTGPKRQAAVDRFQDDPNCRVFIGNKAAEEGITLTAANNLVRVELPWTPGSLSQSEARIHRIGQTADVANYYYLVADGTIEEEIMSILDRKLKVLNKVLDGKDVDEEEMLTELLKKRLER